MKPILIAGTLIVNLALISYTIFILTERKSRLISDRVIAFLTAGVLLDITATICMIAGSENSPFTLHGILGYSALAGMLLDSILIWRSRLELGQNAKVTVSVHRYSIIAYCWWVTAYLTGAMLVILK